MRLTGVIALLVVGLLCDVKASSAQGTAEDTVVAARVALLALQASALGTHGPIEQYIMLPSLGTLDEDQVIKALISLWKPAECSAWQDGTTMWLTCWSRDQIPDQSLLDGATGAANALVQSLRERFPGKTSTKILVQDSLSRITVTDKQFERFVTDYFVVPASRSTRFDIAPPNVDAVVTIRRSKSGH